MTLGTCLYLFLLKRTSFLLARWGRGGGMNLQLRVIFSSLVIPGCCYPLKIIPIINYYFLFNTLLKLDTEYMTFIVVVVIAVVVAVKKSLKRNFFSSNNFQRVTNLEKR